MEGTGIPLATRISSINAKESFNLDKNATSSGIVTLTFHYAHNILRRDAISNSRILAPFGRAILNGNGTLSPTTFDSADYVRNCISTSNCTDIETSGVYLTNAHYHGEIGVNNSGKIRLHNILTYRNGYRGVHYHGDSPSSAITDLWADEIESQEDGYKAFQVSGEDWNSGLFLCFDNCKRYQVGRLRAKKISGLGVHLTGNISGGVHSSTINYQSIQTEDVFLGTGLFPGLRHVSIGSIQAKGTITQIANCTLGTGTVQLPRVNSSNVPIPGAVMASITLPVGTDMSQFWTGMVVYLQDVTPVIRNISRRIWSVDVGTRTVNVFTDDNGATRPWDVSLDSTTTTVTFTTTRHGVFLNHNNVASQQCQDISIVNLQADTIGGKVFASNNSGAGVVSTDGLYIGTLQQRDCMDGSSFICVNNLSIGNFKSTNVSDKRTGNDTSTSDLVVNNSDGVVINSFYGITSTIGATTTTNRANLVLSGANVKNVKVFNVMAQNGNGSNFAIDWSNSVNVMLGDPRNLAGTALTPSGAATNGSAFKYGLA